MKKGDEECNQDCLGLTFVEEELYWGQEVKNTRDDPRLEAVSEVDCERDAA